MRLLVKLFRFVLEVQGAVILGGRILRDEGAVEVEIRRRRNAQARCGGCRTKLTGALEPTRCRWRHLDLVGKMTYLVASVRTGYCARCGGRRMEGVPWASARARHTRRFDRQVASLVEVADKTAATRMFGITWPTAGRIVARVVGELLPKDRLQGLEYIGIDETSYKRAHRYITVVSDLITSRVVWVGEGKSGETLGRFFTELGTMRSQEIKLVAIDMSEAYRRAVKDFAPQADIVYDRFHVVKLLLDAIDEIRRDEVRKLQGKDREALKSTRFALLRNPRRHLSPRDKEAINRVRATNQKLARAYELRVDFEDFWMCRHEDDARKFVMNWTRSALLSRREPLRRFATTVRKHIDGILGYFRWGRMTNAVMEGTNNKIKLVMHRAYGFHSLDALMAMIYLCCGGVNLMQRFGNG